jgi:hypothetical protein
VRAPAGLALAWAGQLGLPGFAANSVALVVDAAWLAAST